MDPSHVLILSSGGLRSLVATALVLQEGHKRKPGLLFVVDGRESASRRLTALHQQADHFGLKRVIELDMPHLFGREGAHEQGESVPRPMLWPQMLLAALGQARREEAAAVVWPAGYDAQTEPIARASERMILATQLAETEGAPTPRLHAPLLELSDQQIVELGAQLDVPWNFSRSCLLPQAEPCGMCQGCRRRKAAFAKAGIPDGSAPASLTQSR